MPLRPDDIATMQFASEHDGMSAEAVRAFLEEVAREHDAIIRRANEAEIRLADLSARLRQAEELVRSADGIYRAAQEHLKDLETERDAALGALRRLESLSGAELADQVGQQAAQVLLGATVAAHSIQAEAEARAERARLNVQQQVILIDQAARSHAEQAHQQAHQILWEARQQAAQIIDEAHRAARETQFRAEPPEPDPPGP